MTHAGRNRITKLEKIRIFGEKETYKFLGILEADASKQLEMNEKILKSVSQDNEETVQN